jgi:hypothetical protein
MAKTWRDFVEKRWDSSTVTYVLFLLKVKESRDRPGVAQRVPGSLGSQISMTFGT